MIILPFPPPSHPPHSLRTSITFSSGTCKKKGITGSCSVGLGLDLSEWKIDEIFTHKEVPRNGEAPRNGGEGKDRGEGREERWWKRGVGW